MQQQLYQHIFRKADNDPDTHDFLKGVTKQYPYFGAAHFYLLKNKDKGPDFEIAAAKTVLFFNDPFFLDLQLQEEQAQIPKEIIPPDASAQQTPVLDTAIPAKETATEEPLFEPLHASDYFASQGIKLSEDALNEDKLGKQLKSFTAWLKTMKKVHPDKMAEPTGVESAVQQLAEKSNQEEDVLTEAMADAYLLQGKQAKAVETWRKLSLLYPSKTAYFAAKIDSLNQ